MLKPVPWFIQLVDEFATIFQLQFGRNAPFRRCGQLRFCRKSQCDRARPLTTVKHFDRHIDLLYGCLLSIYLQPSRESQ
jgi:hypothetical protein